MSPSPDFLGIGAERSGTSWIYACLQEHPDLCMPEKELNFFSRTRNWQKGLDWYRSQFASCEDDQLKGEFSTSYLSDPKTPERIAEHFPDVKLLVSLRNPIDRAYSSYRNDLSSGDLPEGISFDQAVSDNPKYIEMSRYATHLRRYLDYFDDVQLKILPYEFLQSDPESFIQSIFEFLGVDRTFQPTMLNERINPSRSSRIQGLNKVLNSISKILRSSRLTRSAWWLAKRLGIGRFIRTINSRDDDSEGLPRHKINEFREPLQDEVTELRAMLNWSENVWSDYFPPDREDPNSA